MVMRLTELIGTTRDLQFTCQLRKARTTSPTPEGSARIWSKTSNIKTTRITRVPPPPVGSLRHRENQFMFPIITTVAIFAAVSGHSATLVSHTDIAHQVDPARHRTPQFRSDDEVGRLARDFRIQTYALYRMQRDEYDHRYDLGNRLLGQFSSTEQTAEQKKLVTGWYQDAMSIQERNLTAAIPPLPSLASDNFSGAYHISGPIDNEYSTPLMNHLDPNFDLHTNRDADSQSQEELQDFDTKVGVKNHYDFGDMFDVAGAVNAQASPPIIKQPRPGLFSSALTHAPQIEELEKPMETNRDTIQYHRTTRPTSRRPYQILESMGRRVMTAVEIESLPSMLKKANLAVEPNTPSPQDHVSHFFNSDQDAIELNSASGADYQ